MGWKDTIKKSDEEKPKSWRDTIKAPEPSELESTVRGAVQGIPFVGSYADEATGMGEHLLTGKPYEQARDESRENYKAAADANPKSYYGGMLGAALPIDAAKMVPFLGQGLGAVEGGIYGLGASEADLTKGEYGKAALDTGVGATIGAVAPKILKAGGKLVGKVLGKGEEALEKPAQEFGEHVMEDSGLRAAGDTVSVPQGPQGPTSILKEATDEPSKSDVVKKWLADKFGDRARKSVGLLTNSDDEMMQKYMADRAGVNAARPVDELAADAVGNVDKLRDRVVKGSREAAELISDDIAVPNSQLIDKLKEMRRPLSESYTDTGQAAKGEIDRIIGRLQQEIKPPAPPPKMPKEGWPLGPDLLPDIPKALPPPSPPVLSGQKLKKFIKNLDQEIDYADRAGEIMTPASQAKLEFRKYLDSILKQSSPEYAGAMQAVAKDAEALDVTRKMFSRQDATASRLKSAANRPTDKREVREALGTLDERLGSKLSKENDARKVQEYFNEDLSGGRGPRNRIIGSAIGGAIGGIFGPVGVAPGMYAGMKAGQYLDTHGRQLAKSAMDAAANPNSLDFLNRLEAKIPSLPPKYQQALQSASQRGGNAMAVTHFLLGNQDPEYRKHFSEEDDY